MDLDYKLPVETCIAVERDQLPHHSIHKSPITTQATGDMQAPSVIPLTVGTMYTDAWNSFLTFSITARTNNIQDMYLTGGFASLIDRVVLFDRFGKEIEKCENMSLFQEKFLRSTFGDEYIHQTSKPHPLEPWVTANTPSTATGQVPSGSSLAR